MISSFLTQMKTVRKRRGARGPQIRIVSSENILEKLSSCLPSPSDPPCRDTDFHYSSTALFVPETSRFVGRNYDIIFTAPLLTVMSGRDVA